MKRRKSQIVTHCGQLTSYIAPAAPATRRPATGQEPYLRAEVGFTPRWYRQRLGIDFGRQWHASPSLRGQGIRAMRAELRRRFAGTAIGGIDRPDSPLDLLTGALGACTVAAIYGVPIVYTNDNWPNCEHRWLSDAQLETLTPPDLSENPAFMELMSQLDAIAALEGRIEGYINWQGILNNAQRLRGQQLFLDMFDRPDSVRHLFDCVCTTMIEAARRVYARQAASGVSVGFFTVSNCLVNLISPAQYRDMVLPFDRRIAAAFHCIGIHNCAWTADPYLEHYAQVPHVGYIDMGLHSDLVRARQLFPQARRALMYTPMDLAGKDIAEIRQDLARVAADYGPCDIVAADIDADTPDEKVRQFVALCDELSRQYE